MKKLKLREEEKFETIREYINRGIKKYNKNNAFIIKIKNNNKINYKNITYKEFGEDIKNLGTKLIDMGLENKRIAIIGKNSYEWVCSYISVICGVGVAVPLDKGLQDDEIISLLNRSKADAIIFENKYLELIKKIKKEKNTQIKEFICMNKNEEFFNIYELINDGKKLIKNKNNKYLNHKINPEEMATIIFTSGTTSMAKAVVLTNKNIASNIYDLNCTEKIYSTDVNLAFLPLHHAFGSTGMILFLANGATNVFCDGLRHIQNNLKEYKVTTFVCVPLLLENIYKKIINKIEKEKKKKIIKIAIIISNLLLKIKIDIRRKIFKPIINELGGNIRFIISGASAIDKKVAKGFNDLGIELVQGYGLTETAPVIAAENAYKKRSGSIGFPMDNVELEIVDKDENGIGELRVKGPNVMLGYYENEEETNKVIRDGWFYTGDLGYIDKDGFIFLTGRQKDMIVLKNGKKVFPEELETLINRLDLVKECIVYGMPDEKDKNDLKLSVKIVYNTDIAKEKYPDATEEELRKIIWEQIKEINKTFPPYKYIKNMILTDQELIKTTTQKVKRQEEIKKILGSK